MTVQMQGELQPGHSESEEKRKVTWLELFYDLVYVATIIQLGNVLSENISWMGFFEFVSLFLPVWWSWMGVTFYANRFLSDDVWHRVLIFVQIFAVAALAIGVPTAFEPGISRFALAYVGVRLVLVILFLRVPPRGPVAQPLARRYAFGFTISALIWLVAAFVPMPLRYGLWIIGMLVDFVVPLHPTTRRLVMRMPPAREHIAERFALFTMIVLGESFVKVITSVPGEALGWNTFVFGAIGLIVAGSVWWLYFDHIPEAAIKPGKAYTWIYAHLPLVIGITALAVAINKIVVLQLTEPLAAKYRWLFCVTVMICLGAIALINSVTYHATKHSEPYRLSRAQLAAAGGVFLVAIIGGMLPALVVVGLVAALCVSQVTLSWYMKGNLAIAASTSG